MQRKYVIWEACFSVFYDSFSVQKAAKIGKKNPCTQRLHTKLSDQLVFDIGLYSKVCLIADEDRNC
jgi:hypothetical protein